MSGREQRGGGTGARERPGEPGGAGERVPTFCPRCLPSSLRVLGEGKQPESPCLPPEGAEFTRNELIDSWGGALPSACSARGPCTALPGRVPRSPSPARPASPLPLTPLLSWVATDEQDCCLLASRCSFIHRALKLRRRRKGKEGWKEPLAGLRGIMSAPSGMEIPDQRAAKENRPGEG